MLIKMNELNAMKPDISGDRINVYYLSKSDLAKRFLKCYGASQLNKKEKYECAASLKNLNNVSVPFDLLETERGFCGYTEKILPGTFDEKLICYTDLINKDPYSIKIEDITEYILKCVEIVANCHEAGIINPDMATGGNVLYNNETKEVYFLDYQDMQIKDIPSFVISSFIADDPILTSEKYIKDGIYSKNIDIYTLAIRYFYYISKINVPRAVKGGYKINDLISMSGISNTKFAECLESLYNPNIDNLDIKDAIIELSEEYQMGAYKAGQIRQLINKKTIPY